MMLSQNKPYSRAELTMIADAFRAIAMHYDSRGLKLNLFDCGICAAYTRYVRLYSGVYFAGWDGDAYYVVDWVIAQVQEGWKPNQGSVLDLYTSDVKDWSPRATMCLLMAEWIESELL